MTNNIPSSLLLLPAREIVAGSSEDLYGVISFYKGTLKGGLFDNLRSLSNIALGVVKALAEREDPYDTPDGASWVLPGAHSLSIGSGYCMFINPHESFRLIDGGESLRDMLDGAAVNRLTGGSVAEALDDDEPAVISFPQWYQSMADTDLLPQKMKEIDFWNMLVGGAQRSELDRLTLTMGGPYQVKRGVPLTWIRPEEQFMFCFESLAKHADGMSYETEPLSLPKVLGTVSDAVISLNG